MTIDWIGCFSIIGVVLLVLLGLDYGGVAVPWDSPRIICMLVFGFVLLGVFLVVEAKVAKHPLIPLWIFNDRSNIAVLVYVACHGFVSSPFAASTSYHLFLPY